MKCTGVSSKYSFKWSCVLNLNILVLLIVTVLSFSGPELWVKQLSLSECADEYVVQEVFKKELSRPSSRLGRKSPSRGSLPSVLPGGEGLFKAASLHCKQQRPSTSLNKFVP